MSIEFFAGNSRKLVVEVISENGTDPEDLTDVTLRWQCSRGTASKFSATPVLTKTLEDGIEITDVLNGMVEITLTSDDTTDLSGIFYHELLLVDSTGDQQNVLADIMTIKRRLVKPAP